MTVHEYSADPVLIGPAVFRDIHERDVFHADIREVHGNLIQTESNPLLPPVMRRTYVTRDPFIFTVDNVKTPYSTIARMPPMYTDMTFDRRIIVAILRSVGHEILLDPNDMVLAVGEELEVFDLPAGQRILRLRKDQG